MFRRKAVVIGILAVAVCLAAPLDLCQLHLREIPPERFHVLQPLEERVDLGRRRPRVFGAHGE